jgi:hypothetical protein
VISSSANISYHRSRKKQTDLLRVDAYGGLTEVSNMTNYSLRLTYFGYQAELRQWWLRNHGVDRGGYTENEIEDLTGSIPLLLDGCVVDGRIDLSAEALTNVFEQVIELVWEQHKKEQPYWDA